MSYNICLDLERVRNILNGNLNNSVRGIGTTTASYVYIFGLLDSDIKDIDYLSNTMNMSDHVRNSFIDFVEYHGDYFGYFCYKKDKKCVILKRIPNRYINDGCGESIYNDDTLFSINFTTPNRFYDIGRIQKHKVFELGFKTLNISHNKQVGYLKDGTFTNSIFGRILQEHKKINETGIVKFSDIKYT